MAYKVVGIIGAVLWAAGVGAGISGLIVAGIILAGVALFLLRGK